MIGEDEIILTVLGCGDGGGVPRIGGEWGKCNPDNPKNRRTRPSVMVQSKTTTIVVDTGVDFYGQLTRYNVMDISAVLYTHAHADHINGMDDLRSFFRRTERPTPCFMDRPTYVEIDARFGYLLQELTHLYPRVTDVHLLEDADMGQERTIGDIRFTPFIQDHGANGRSLGFRFGDVGYSTDMVALDEQAIKVLKDCRVWIADCADFGKENRFVHAALPEVIALRDEIGAEQVFLTHLGIGLDYDALLSACPAGMEPAYDGLRIPVRGAKA